MELKRIEFPYFKGYNPFEDKTIKDFEGKSDWKIFQGGNP